MLDRIHQIFLGPIDARVYVLFRRCYGFLLLCTWLTLWPRRHQLLANTGMLDSNFALQSSLSIFAFWNSEWQVTLAMLIAPIAIGLIIFGRFTRFALALTYIWVVSYSSFIGESRTGLDSFLRVFGFLLLISPTQNKAMVSKYGLVMIQWQVFIMYVSTFLARTYSSNWQEGWTISYFLLSIHSKVQYPFVAYLGIVSVVLTYATLAIELCVCFLLWNRRTRVLGFLLGWGMHLSIACVSKGTIPLMSMAVMIGYLAFLNADDLKRLKLI